MKRRANPISACGGRAFAFLAVLLLAASFLAMPAEAFQQRQVGSWVLKSGSGRFGPYCTVENVQDGRTLGYQAMRSGQFFLGLRNPAWNWEPKSMQAVQISVGRRGEWKGSAISALPDTLVLAVPRERNRPPTDVLLPASSLSVTVGGRSIAFDLAGFPEAAQAQRDCLAQPI